VFADNPTEAEIGVDSGPLPLYSEPMKVTAQYAEDHLADILNAADKGEKVEIARPEQPTYRLELVKPAANAALPRPRRELPGAWEGLVTAPTEQEWRSIKRDLAGIMPDFSPRTDEAA